MASRRRRRGPTLTPARQAVLLAELARLEPPPEVELPDADLGDLLSFEVPEIDPPELDADLSDALNIPPLPDDFLK